MTDALKTGVDANWAVAAPITIVVVAALVAMMVDAFSKDKLYTALVAVAGFAIAIVDCVRLWGNTLPPTFALKQFVDGAWLISPGTGQLIADNYGLLLNILILSIGLLTIWTSVAYLDRQKLQYGEYYILLLFAVSGMMLMVQSTELITIFVALEIFSVSLYVLSAFARTKKRSEEAGLKYLLLGAFSSAFFLYGIALVYGAMGTTNLYAIRDALARTPAGLSGFGQSTLPIGIGLILVGFAFKVAAVPFHVWTPDVYEGAPTPVTAFMSVATKAAAFGALGRILLFAFPTEHLTWGPIVASLSIATMILGNFTAVWQQNIKRMLAYSSIAHAGYLLIGFVGVDPNNPARVGDTTGILFYLLAYGAMNFGAFAAVTYLSNRGREFNNIDDFRGLAYRNLGVATAMSIFMFSLAGIPPALGYWGKAVLFINAVERGQTYLVVVGVLTSVVSAYYYLRVVVAMWMREPEPQVKPGNLSPGVAITVGLCALVTLLIGLAPSSFMNAASKAVTAEPPGLARTITPPGTLAQK